MSLPLSSSRHLIPEWIRQYPRQKFGADLAAGLIVTVLVIPQSLAYALLAGLPPQMGLYVSILPVIAYALLGSSMVQAVGPVAITAIMTYAVLSPIATPGTPEYITLAAALSLLSGLMILACGVLRLGFLSQLLSRPVISGFISGSSVLIVLSQARHLFGLPANTRPWPPDTLASLIHGPTALIGLAALVALILGRTSLGRLLEGLGMKASRAAFIVRLMPLLIIFIATMAVVFLDLDHRHGVKVVGSIAQGLPDLSLSLPGIDSLTALAVPAFVMTLIGMVQGISMAQSLAIKRRERVDANAELVGLGSANIVAAFSGGMPVGAGVSRSAVNVAAGAQTPLAGIVSALAMIVVVAGAAHWFERLPLTVLAASIMVAAFTMIDFKVFRQAWAYDRADGLAYLGTAGGVLIFGIEAGIGIGVLLSTATLLFRASTPHIAIIGRIPGSEHFRNVARHAVETIPGVLFIRIDERLFYGNLGAVEIRLNQELEYIGQPRDVVFVMSAVNLMDATAAEVFGELNQDLMERGIRLHLAEVKGPIQDRLTRTELWKSLSGKVFLSANEAFEALSSKEK